MKKKVLCVIDDKTDELSRFKKAFDNYYTVITGLNDGVCQEELRKRNLKKPDLWIMDLYFRKLGEEISPNYTNIDKQYEAICVETKKFNKFLGEVGLEKRGLKYLEQYKEKNEPVIIFTRKGTLDDGIECLQKGADKVLRKPRPEKWSDDKEQRKVDRDRALEGAAKDFQEEFDNTIKKYSYWVGHRSKVYWFFGLVVGSVVTIVLDVFTRFLFP